MSQQTGRAKRSEKGLLTPDNCVVAIIDLQIASNVGHLMSDDQMVFGVDGDLDVIADDT